jgi:hypothetical protein
MFRRVAGALVAVVALMCVAGAAQARAANVAILFNDSYVDVTSTGDGAEAVNERDSISALGHTVTPFTDISGPGFTGATAGQDALVIPELEHGDLAPDLTPDAEAAIRNFVAGGGELVVNGRLARSDAFLNAVFGFSTVADFTDGSTTITKQAAATGTEFDGGPTTLPILSATRGLRLTDLPAGAANVYGNGTVSNVTIIPFGAGSIMHIGWDWFDSTPPNTGGNDGGWQSILADALVKPTLTVPDAEVVEGNAGQRSLVFTAALSEPVSEEVSVHYATADGSASGASDYKPTSGTLTFARGETVKTVSVPVNGDTAGELNETLTLALSAPVAADLTRQSATGTIINDDVATRDSQAPGVKLSTVPKSMKLGKLRKGLKVSATSTEPTGVDFSLLGSARQVSLARAGDLTLAHKALRVGTGKRTVKLKPSKRLLKNPRKTFKLKLVVVATDVAGNAKTVRRTIKIRR